MRMASEIGCQHVQVIGNTAGDGWDQKWVAARYRELIEIGLNDYNLRPALVFVKFQPIKTLGQALGIALDANHAKAMIIPDTFHMYISGGGFEALKHVKGGAIAIFQFEIRPVNEGKLVALTTTASPPVRPATPTTNPPMPASTPAVPGENLDITGKRVLIVIANEDFFYREYSAPRAELERAGAVVEVAAGRKSPCRPHGGSGYTEGDGTVVPDLALSDVDPARYDAIMFSGGWGASMYQYAFEGRYDNPAYNGSNSVKRTVNELINAFVKADKYVGGLCHGVSILAWSRVNGKSLLDGKTVCAYPNAAPSGTNTEGQRQWRSTWDSEVNGATVSPSRSIGNPSTDRDDVRVDGKILTGENDPSAQAFGQLLVRLLAGKTG